MITCHCLVCGDIIFHDYKEFLVHKRVFHGIKEENKKWFVKYVDLNVIYGMDIILDGYAKNVMINK